MVGGMGHTGMVSLGVSFKNKNQVVCIDGDGSLLMHLGSLRSQGIYGGKNFKHILLNNCCHEVLLAGKQLLQRRLTFQNYQNY